MSFNYRFIILFLSCLLVLPFTHVQAEKHPTSTAILYTKETEQLNFLQNMLSAYTDVTTIPLEQAMPETLRQYDHLIVTNFTQTRVAKNIIETIESFAGQVIVIGPTALQFAPFSDWKLGKEVQIYEIGDVVLQDAANWQTIEPAPTAKIIKTAASFTDNHPFIAKAHDERWTYVAALPLDRAIIYEWPKYLLDVLHIKIDSTASSLFALTQVNMKTDVQHLKEVVSVVEEAQLPVILEITPYLTEADGVVYPLENNKSLIDYLQQLQRKGAAFILAPSNTSVEKSVDYLALNGIYVNALNQPEESTVFSNYVIQNPLAFFKEEGEHTLFPYNIDIIVGDGEYALYDMEQQVRRMASIPNVMIGIALPNYFEVDAVKELAQLLVQNQINIIDLRKVASVVKTENVHIQQLADGEQQVTLSFTVIERLKMLFDNRPFEFGLWVLVIVVALFVSVFFINTLRLRVTLRKRLFEERRQNG